MSVRNAAVKDRLELRTASINMSLQSVENWTGLRPYALEEGQKPALLRLGQIIDREA